MVPLFPGMGIQQRHCQIEDTGNGWTISSPGHSAVVLINGQSIEEIGQVRLFAFLQILMIAFGFL